MSLHLTPRGYEELLSAPDDIAIGYRTWHRDTFRTDEYIVEIEVVDDTGLTLRVTTDTTYEHPAGRGFVPDTGPQPELPTKRTDERIIRTPFPIELVRPYLIESAA